MIDLCANRKVYDELLRRHFPTFIAKVLETLAPGTVFLHNWHIDAISWQLERTVAGEVKRLVVTIPPRQLKSTIISVAWVAWRLGHNPEREFVCASYSNELSAKLARDCYQIMESAWYQRIFPRTRLRRTAAQDFRTTRGGGRYATSLAGTVTGRGGHELIIDDAMKPSDAASDTIRNNVNELFDGTLYSRLNDREHGVIIIIMQRLHEDDLVGHVLEKEPWTHLNLPAIATADEDVPIGPGVFYRRREGVPLHPSAKSAATLARLKSTVGSDIWQSQYQQQADPRRRSSDKTRVAAPLCGPTP